jgi:hypothetical protein
VRERDRFRTFFLREFVTAANKSIAATPSYVQLGGRPLVAEHLA